MLYKALRILDFEYMIIVAGIISNKDVIAMFVELIMLSLKSTLGFL